MRNIDIAFIGSPLRVNDTQKKTHSFSSNARTFFITKAAQTSLFGEMGGTKPAAGTIRTGRSYLEDYCFGDFYTRTGLTIEQHELLTWCCIAALGGAESQITGHTNGNKNAGRDKQYMLEVLTTCVPYIGYPRTLNALNIVNSVYDAE